MNQPRGIPLGAANWGRISVSDHNTSDRGTPETTTSDRERVDDATPIGRRNFLLGAGTAVAAGLAPTAAAQAQQPQAGSAAAAGWGSQRWRFSSWSTLACCSMPQNTPKDIWANYW